MTEKIPEENKEGYAEVLKKLNLREPEVSFVRKDALERFTREWNNFSKEEQEKLLKMIPELEDYVNPKN